MGTDLAEQELASQSVEPRTDADRLKIADELVQWLESRNPDWRTNRPEDLDWQAIKSEARRY